MTSSVLCARTILTEVCARSRMIDSTSRPTYPTSVNLVASTLINGALTSLASLRAISVLPTPVEPIIKIFFGITSSCISAESWRLLQRFLRAMATDLFASFCPTICLSSSATISLGVCSLTPKLLILLSSIKLIPPFDSTIY